MSEELSPNNWMQKELIFPSQNDRGLFAHLVADKYQVNQQYLEKNASEYNPTIASYINNAKPIPGKTQILLTALGAGEYWGSNVNGDYFPEKFLAADNPNYGHKTFEHYAKYFKHHLNKETDRSYGTVALSVYNPVYHRVELIVILDNASSPQTADKLNDGETLDFSMGCRVPFDVCSICRNKARFKSEYCEHARFNLNRIDPGTNKQVYVVNYFPRFHDISEVLIGADRIAKSLMKVAHVHQRPSGIYEIGSAALAEKRAEALKKAEENKLAEMDKEVPVTAPKVSSKSLDQLLNSIAEVKACESPLPLEVLNRLGSFPISKSMSTMASLGILPKPQEFQRIFLNSVGKNQLADNLERCNVCFSPEMVSEPKPVHEEVLGLGEENFEPRLFDILKPFIEQRSYSAPHLAKRIVIMVKHAEEKNLPYFIKTATDLDQFKIQNQDDDERNPIGILPMLMAAAGLYAAFGKKAPDAAIGGVDKLISKNPGLAAALGVGLASTFGSMFGPSRKGQHTPAPYTNPDVSDVKGFVQRHTNGSISKTAVFAEAGRRTGASFKRLFLGIPAVYLGSGLLQKHKEFNPYSQEGGVKSFIRKNPDVISGALIADALLASRGKGTYGITRTLTPKLKTLISGLDPKKAPGLPKSAEAIDFASNVAKGLAYPLAIGGTNIPFKMAGGLFDQAVLAGMNKVLNKKKAEKSEQ